MRRALIGWIGTAAAVALSTQGACGSNGSGGSSAGDSGADSTSGSSSGSDSGSSSGGSSGGSSGADAGADSSADSSADSGGTDGSTVATGDSVLTHHKNANRDGLYVQPTFTKAAIGTLHHDTTFSATLPVDGGTPDAIYAQPLFVDGQGGQDLVVVVTESNNVYALDGTTGAQVWGKNLGAPAPQTALPCGNIFPLGITGTPVIDYASRTLYLDAMIMVSAGSAPPPHHQIFALSLDTGVVKSGWPVDVDTAATSGTSTFNSAFQGQRGALALFGGTLYVPYGGLFGDCQPSAQTLYPGTAPYHGWVVAVSTSNPANVSAWATTAEAGGMWTPGGVSSDGTSLFASTGNTQGTGGITWGGGDAFLRLTPAPLGLGAYFAPENWYDLDNGDLDMGTAPIPFDLAGSTPSTLAIFFGKDGNAYLVDRTNPGSVGMALGGNAACSATDFTNACASFHAATDEIISAPALYTTATATYVAVRGNGGQCTSGSGDLLTVKVLPGSPPTVTESWCATNGTGSPMVTTSDGHSDAIVWDLGAENDNRLHAFDGDTGAAIAFTGNSVAFPGMTRYTTPIAAKGRIYFAVAGGVIALTL